MKTIKSILEKLDKGIEHLRCPSISGGNVDDFVFNENDIEQIKQFIRTECEGLLDGLKREEKKRQFPLAKKIKDRVYDCDVWAYNQREQKLRDDIERAKE